MTSIETLATVLDLGGTFVFAISGGLAAVNRRLDIFGILVLSFVAGNFGGITRDVLIGAVPPAALSSVNYLFASVVAGLLTFFSMQEWASSRRQFFTSTRSGWLSSRSLGLIRPLHMG